MGCLETVFINLFSPQMKPHICLSECWLAWSAVVVAGGEEETH
jgi:hypothetical protein